MIYFWVVSVEDDFGVFESFWGGFSWSIPWTQLYKLRRTHRRAVVAVVMAGAATVTTATASTTATTTAATATATTTATTVRLCVRLSL